MYSLLLYLQYLLIQCMYNVLMLIEYRNFPVCVKPLVVIERVRLGVGGRGFDPRPGYTNYEGCSNVCPHWRSGFRG